MAAPRLELSRAIEVLQLALKEPILIPTANMRTAKNMQMSFYRAKSRLVHRAEQQIPLTDEEAVFLLTIKQLQLSLIPPGTLKIGVPELRGYGLNGFLKDWEASRGGSKEERERTAAFAEKMRAQGIEIEEAMPETSPSTQAQRDMYTKRKGG